MKEQNILGGNFYWFEHNWHYIRKWEHFKKAVSLNALHPELKAAVIQQTNKDFSASDAIMSRCISTSVSLSWTEEQAKEKGEKIVQAIKGRAVGDRKYRLKIFEIGNFNTISLLTY